jgi:hypothetical protein
LSETSSLRACKQCANDRVRCSRGQPCKRCSDRESTCSYPPARKATTRYQNCGVSALPQQNQPHTGPSLSGNNTGHFDSNFDVQISTLTSDLPTAITFPSTMSTAGGVPMSWTSNYDSAPSLLDQPDLNALGVNWMSPNYQDDVDWEAILTGFTASHDIASQTIQGATAIEQSTCPGCDINHHTNQTLQLVPHLETTHSYGTAVSTPTPLSTTNIYYVDGTGARAPFGGRSRGRSLILNDQELGEAEIDVTSPPLSDTPSIADDLCPQTAYDNLAHHILSDQQHHGINHSVVTLPPRSHIHLCVLHYFERFHPIFPFIRKASFVYTASTEWLLLLAVAATGSRYIRRRQRGESGDMLTTTLDMALQSRRYGFGTENSHESNGDLFVPGLHTRSESCPDIPMLQAGILNVLLLQHSGERTLVERSLVERHYLTQACHSLELISQDAPMSCMGNTLDPALIPQWLVRQSEVRVGMMIWVSNLSLT